MKLTVTSVLLSILLASNGGPGADAQASPPYYPAPKGGWISNWSASYTKAAAMVRQMTLAEKVNVTTSTGWQMVLIPYFDSFLSLLSLPVNWCFPHIG